VATPPACGGSPGLRGGPVTNVTSFGQDQAGELYMTGSDAVVRIVAAP